MTSTNDDFSSARRRWLHRSLVGAASAFGAGSLVNLLAAAPAQAADYKALVCVFLYGGNDGMNMIVPTDATRHAQYAAVRKGLAVPRSSLAALTGSDYGLHPAMSALQSVWNTGQLAPVFNVGPLYQPLSKAEYGKLTANSIALPESLFSHSHQQVLWETCSSIASERTGWGGRASEILGTANPVVSVGGNGRFGLSSRQVPLVLPSPGSSFGLAGLTGTDLNPSQAQARLAALKTMYDASSSNQLVSAYSRQQRDAFEMASRLGDLIKVKPGSSNPGNFGGINAAFAGLTVNGALQTSMARQLYQVAKLIAANTTVQGSRQIFFAQLGGFDLHASQAAAANSPGGNHAALLKELGDAMAAFQSAMESLGMSEQVTAFTQSDFGRTFTPNNSLGTDHAWGNHHLVMGGAVKGKATYGRYPELVLGGADDVGSASWDMQGRWIPSSSVDQYAATLLRWFGATESQLNMVLPNLSNFGSKRSLGFV